MNTLMKRVASCAMLLPGAVMIAACGVTDETRDDAPEHTGIVSSAVGGGFAVTCTNIRLTNACDYNSYCNLGAWCLRADGSANFGAWWNLDNAIWNNNGNLNQGGGSGFSQTCQDIRIEDSVWLGARCKDRSGTISFTSYQNINDCLTNWNGELHWTC